LEVSRICGGPPRETCVIVQLRYTRVMIDHLSEEYAQRAGDAQISVRIGKAIVWDARISAAGLLAVGALVSGALLGSAVIVLAAKRPRPSPDDRIAHRR
jgi:hypothetical protein